MPQIQVLPSVPSFGERLADTLGNALGQAGSSYLQRRALKTGRENDRNIIDQYSKIPNPTWRETIDYFNKLSRNGQKALSPLFSTVVKEGAKGDLNKNLYGAAVPGQRNLAPPLDSVSPTSLQDMQHQPAGQTLPVKQEAFIDEMQQSSLPQGQTVMPEGAPMSSPIIPQAKANQVSPRQQQSDIDDPTTWSESELLKAVGLKGAPAPYNQYGHQAEAELRRREFTRQLGSKEQIQKNKERRDEVRKFIEPYRDINALEDSLKTAEEIRRLVKDKKVSIDNNKLQGFISGILEGKDLPISEYFETADQQKLGSLLRKFLKSKEIGGSNPSTREVLIALQTLPSKYKSDEANAYIAENLVNISKKNLLTGEAIKETRKKNPDVALEDLQDRIKESTEKEANVFEKKKIAREQVSNRILPKDSVWMISPNGEVGSVPKKDVVEAKKQDYTLLNE